MTAPAPETVTTDESWVSEATARSRRAWRRIIVQFVGIAVAVAVLAVYLATADLTATERTTLAPDQLTVYIGQHLALTFVSAVIVLAIGLPLGVLLTRRPLRFLTGPVLALANVGQSAPAIGLIVLLAFWLGFGFEAAIVALVLYALLPVLRNTMIGIDQVDPQLIEAGRGIGMSSVAVLFRVELPLAVPIMLSGIRTALVLLVGTAALATFIDGGGLGLLITTGVNLGLNTVLIVGALIVALLALLIDLLGGIVELIAQPKGLS